MPLFPLSLPPSFLFSCTLKTAMHVVPLSHVLLSTLHPFKRPVNTNQFILESAVRSIIPCSLNPNKLPKIQVLYSTILCQCFRVKRTLMTNN